MSISIQITHNPFVVETQIIINGQEPACNSGIAQFRTQRLQLWIDHLFTHLKTNFNGETHYEVSFRGLPSDYNDMEIAVNEANEQGFNITLTYTEVEDGEIRLQKIQSIMKEMEQNPLFSQYIEQNQDVREKFQAAFNRDFDVYVVATMSSGKSTLINALVGCSMLPALNEATTATIARITDDDQAKPGHFTARRISKTGEILDDNTNLVFDNKNDADQSLRVLSTWNKQEDTFQIDITGNIIGIQERENVRLVLSDTPARTTAKTKPTRLQPCSTSAIRNAIH